MLAGMFRFGGVAYDDVADLVTTNTFTVDSNQIIWSCLSKFFKENPTSTPDYPSLMSVAKTLHQEDFLSQPQERQHLRAIMNYPILMENVRRMAGNIRRLEVARLLSDQLAKAKATVDGVTGDESIDQILAMAEGPIFDFTSLLTDDGNQGIVLMGDGAEEYLTHLMDNPREMIGISTGLARYDQALGGGIRANSLDIIAARPKTGKTMLVDNFCLHIAGKLGIPVLNLDTEMTKEEHLHRVAANLAGVAIHDIETGKVTYRPEDRGKVLEAARKLKGMPYHYGCIIGKQFEDVLADMRRWVTRTVGLDENGKAKPCVIVYDYLKMMSSDFLSGDLKEYQALGFITTALKNFMGRFGVGCICFAQLNREGIDKEDTDVISGSDRIIHYCTSFAIYKWKTKEERAEATGRAARYTHKLIPIIGRHGEGLQEGEYINILSEYKFGRITEGETNKELELTGGSPEQGIVVTEDLSEDDINLDLPE